MKSGKSILFGPNSELYGISENADTSAIEDESVAGYAIDCGWAAIHE